MDRITKRELRAALGVDTDAEVVAFYEISASAVSQWPEDEPIPELRQLQAMTRRPELFTTEAIAAARLRARAAAEGAPAAQPSDDLSEAA